ncbi:MAG: ornithine cyclodeaminase family protein [Rhodovibrionaceae bacterium]|nr:ornithine cyclodeaminase family protein [Rhodovibrionaceae bacterium]
MKLGEEIRYLGNADVEACALSLAEVERAVEQMFTAKAAGDATMKPKLALHGEGQALFLASPGVMGTPAYAGIKWVGGGDHDARGLPHIAGTIVLSDAATGMPVAVMDARWVTAVRTAAISAVAAKRMARADSQSIAFIACGLQARAHLAALKPHFPLKRVLAYSRRRSTAETFAEEVRAEGFEAEVLEDPQAAVSGADIVVTTTPVEPRTDPFLDAGWLSPGSFTSMVDLGFSWISETMPALDRVTTDDISQAGSEKLTYPEPYDGEVADLVAGSLQGRQSDEERTALVFAGLGLADVAVAAALYERAEEKDIGRILPA